MLTAFVPARAGSKRVKDKNLLELNGHPLVAHAVAAAVNSRVFCAVYVSTDGPAIAEVAAQHGAGVIDRPSQFAMDDSPDIQWLTHAIDAARLGPDDQFMILRPTNPFRTAATICTAAEWWRSHREQARYDSMRSVCRSGESAGKQWTSRGGRLIRLIPGMAHPYGQNFCDMPTQKLEQTWTQNGCIQVATVATVRKYNNYTGQRVLGFFMDLPEGLDVNTERDVIYATHLIQKGQARTELHGQAKQAAPVQRRRRGRPRKVASADVLGKRAGDPAVD